MRENIEIFKEVHQELTSGTEITEGVVLTAMERVICDYSNEILEDLLLIKRCHKSFRKEKMEELINKISWKI